MSTADFRAARTKACRSLLRGGAFIVDDGKDHSSRPNRALEKDGNGKSRCCGYYATFTTYDEAADMFDGRIPASHVLAIGVCSDPEVHAQLKK